MSDAVQAVETAPDLSFELLAFRIQFKARDSIYFPPGKSGNIVRGAFGSIVRQIACIPQCHDSQACEQRPSCPYARIFEPAQPPATDGPSGLHDWPRPFVFRAAHLDGRTIEQGEKFHFDVHLFDLKDPAIVYFVLAFSELTKQGIGPRRGRADLVRVDQLGHDGAKSAQLYDGSAFLTTELKSPIRLELDKANQPVSKALVRFTTPTELKHGQLLATRPEFEALFGRIRDRLSTLRTLYGSGPLAIDHQAMGERAAKVELTRLKIDFSAAERRSAKTGERHPLGGFVGEAEYHGDLTEFLPYLHAGWWVGVGRQTVWGKGVIETTVLE